MLIRKLAPVIANAWWPDAGGREARSWRSGSTSERPAVAVELAEELLRNNQVRSALEVVEPVVRSIGPAERDHDIYELLLCYVDCLRHVSPTDPENGRTLASDPAPRGRRR